MVDRVSMLWGRGKTDRLREHLSLPVGAGDGDFDA